MSNALRISNSEEGGAAESPSSSATASSPVWKRWLARSWVVALVVVVLIGAQFAIFGYLRNSVSQGPKTPEITLGDFQFVQTGTANSVGAIEGAKFQLHIGLLPEVDRDARARLAARRFKVQQDVEELLRRAHSADFEDPSLGELKRQLQEQINTSLGIRAVGEIIITDLDLRHGTASSTISEPISTAPSPGAQPMP